MENTRVGPFLIFERLGTSRRQKVFRARQVEQNIDVAIKFIGMPDAAIRARAIDKIQLEIERLKELQHPNLVRTLGAGVDGEQVFFATELVKGESLAKLLSRRGKLAADLVVDYGKQTAELLGYLHEQNLVHGKLTPDKILITRDGLVKVSDMRLNRSKRKKLSSKQRSLDEFAYLAPEQFREGTTAKSDIYALGVILFELLTGKLPYPPETLSKLASRKMKAKPPSVLSSTMDCPVWLDQLVTKMIDPDPRRRPHSAKAVTLAFDELKRFDKTQKATVSQVAGTFNPLTAGSDKSEANRLLGQRKSSQSETSFFQSAGFLVGGLAIILAILIFAMIPTSSKRLMTDARALMASEDPKDWLSARDSLKQVMSRGEESEFFSEAEQMYYESRRRSLLMQAEKGRKIALQSFASQQFLDAVQLQLKGEVTEALKVFEKLVESVDENGKERHVHWESSKRVEELKQILIENDPEKLLASIEATRQAATVEELQPALSELKRIRDQLPPGGEFEETAQLLDNAIVDNEQRLQSLLPNVDESDIDNSDN